MGFFDKLKNSGIIDALKPSAGGFINALKDQGKRLYNTGKDYFAESVENVPVVGDAAAKLIRGGSLKEGIQEIPFVGNIIKNTPGAGAVIDKFSSNVKKNIQDQMHRLINNTPGLPRSGFYNPANDTNLNPRPKIISQLIN